jgi:hypothetical protein
MRIAHGILTAIVGLLCSSWLLAEQPGDRGGLTGPIAVSGDAEIDSLHVVRRKAGRTTKTADLTNMTIALWLPGKWNTVREGYMVKLLDLKTIEDDTGNLLTTKTRLEWIRYIKGEVRADTTMSSGGKEGPVIRMVVEAPARGAGKIKSIKGKAEVSSVTLASLSFDDLSLMNDKPLDHPKLKDFPIRAIVDVGDGTTTIKLELPPQDGRLWHWWLEKDGAALSLMSEGASKVNGKILPEKSYRGDRVKEYSLRLSLAEPVETKVFEFDFTNVDLP